jgi:hypothetical protein
VVDLEWPAEEELQKHVVGCDDWNCAGEVFDYDHYLQHKEHLLVLGGT